jgi:hypothetical protein
MARKDRWRMMSVLLLAASFAGCATHVPTAGSDTARSSQKTESSGKAAGDDLLFQRAWRVTSAPSQAAFGSMYIFLANGTLVETSCGEPYRIATWTRDPKDAYVLHVVEDKQPAFTGTIRELSATTLQLEQKLTRGKDVRALTLTGVDGEFVCPDLPK